MAATATPVLLAWSGGKDAAWALHALRQRADVEVVALLTTVTAEYGRSSMQGVRREVLHAQARAAGLPLLEAEIRAGGDNDAYDAAMAAALAEAARRWPGLRTVAFGDLLLEDIRAWREQRCTAAGWRLLTPLFGRDTALLARGMIASGLRAGLCCVDTTQLPAAFAGRDFDEGLLADLPAGVDPCGENGEFHTCVWDGPMFAAPLHLRRGDTVLRDGRFAYTDFMLPASPHPVVGATSVATG
ncbi:ATP-binding protein [Pseudoxanthomonas mexicana]|uniref:Dph6-related ATP pyrophosphatase n=1 Tax=Pseudoxanthomonas mexicana TaxID=128785 RepID=UPI00398B66C8